MALKLATFSLSNAITTEDGKPTTAFLTWINTTVRSIQAFVNDQAQLQADIVTSLEKAGIAITTAEEAKQLAIANAKMNALANSYVSPTDVLSSMLDGTTATITIADHSRVYGDGSTVAVEGATLTGLALSTTFYVVYQDADHKGGTVTYTTTTDSLSAGQSGNQHLVGSITTPTSGSTTPSSGSTTAPPGVGSLAQQKRDEANGGGETVEQ